MSFKRLILAILLTSLPAVNVFAAVSQERDRLANARKEKTVNLYTSMEARKSRQIADVSKETQTLIRGFGRTVSRTDSPQDEISKMKAVFEEIELADRMNEITAEYDKYLQ